MSKTRPYYYFFWHRAITSTPSHMQVDHFLDSVLENSNSSLLQTPRRHSPPPSPPGGMSEHSWLPDLSLSSFLGSLPTDGGVGNNESPSKMLMSHQEDSIQSTGSEVDRQLSMMLNENSLDFTSKFAHLASALNSTDWEWITKKRSPWIRKIQWKKFKFTRGHNSLSNWSSLSFTPLVDFGNIIWTAFCQFPFHKNVQMKTITFSHNIFVWNKAGCKMLMKFTPTRCGNYYQLCISFFLF